MKNIKSRICSTDSGERQPSLMAYPSKLFVETTTRCNLGCVMCVKQTSGYEILEEDMSPETFASLAPAFPHLEALILNGIGEPLLNPHLEMFIRTAKAKMPDNSWIGFQSNGLLLTNLRAVALIHAGLDRICLSIDAATPETFHTLREGGELTDIERAMAAIQNAMRTCNRPDVSVGVEYVVMRQNLTELPAALRWAADHGATFAIVTHVLPYEEQHASESVYNLCTSEAINLFKQYAADALEQNLDISTYFEARWKYTRTPDEQRLVNLVGDMKACASERGLFVDMKKLLQMDISKADDVAEVFERARDVALQCGLDLRLPDISLREERHCGFVEEGGAFISTEGNVSPCYFLWHRYRCFASGWNQQVIPKVFGNVREKNVMEIWNSDAYISFRSQAAGYNYPGCANCSLAPCDYVQNDVFEQDCHIGDVPCGSCLWCMGVFQCMR
ncbi:MAG: radical SAM/SPASM family putative metalloenzyme maturase [Desulfuromonadaceae bacterium]|nr:radical SAM/SPASM family putative metalloenzyme maturase [Desulfuromonadaceae bacterium]MDD5106275.1 radical SAM/SPASM family putative metalloenzyme maturase [Desulfuromonadaceae bacterium]